MQDIVFIRMLDYTSKLSAYFRGKVVESQTKSNSRTGAVIWGRVLSGILALAILGGIVALIYSVAVPFKEPFTEFYILDSNGGTEDYPDELQAGEEAKVIVGIVNHEHETMTYRLEINPDGTTYKEIRQIVLEHEEKFEETVSFTLDKTGDNRKVEFLLFNSNDDEVYSSVLLRINVK